MATEQDTRGTRNFSGTTASSFEDNQDSGGGAPANSASSQRGDPDSQFPTAGPTNRAEPGTVNYRGDQTDASGQSNGGESANGGATGGPNGNSGGATAGGDNGASGNGDGTDTSAGGDGNGTGDGSGDDSGFGLPILGGIGSVGGLGGGLGDGLVHDAVADTQSLGSDVLTDAQGSGNNLITDVVNGTEQLVGNAADNLGLGDLIGDNFIANTAGTITGMTDVLTGGLLDGVTGDLGNGILGDGLNLGNITGDGPALTGSVLDGNGAIVNTLSDATGGATDGILGSSTGDGPLVDLGIVENGSPALSNALGNADTGVLSDLGIGRVAEVSGANDANGDPAVSATAGNGAGDNGAVVNAQAFGDDSASSGNLIDLGAGENGGTSGSGSDVIANAFGGSSDGSNPLADANLIGTTGQSFANADVLTSPDQFSFPVLDGAGTDSLAGVLGTEGSTVASLVPDSAPGIDIGTDPVVDVNLTGDAQTDTQDPLHGTLSGQLLGAV